MDIKLTKRNYVTAFLLTGMILAQNPPWFLWEISYALLSIFLFFILLINHRRLLRKSFLKPKHILLAFVLFFLFFVRSLFDAPKFSSLISTLTFLMLFLIIDEEKILTLKMLTRVLAFLVLISLTAWLIHNFVFSFPLYNILPYGVGKNATDVLSFNNYIFFLEVPLVSVNRFYSVFDEPGTLGTLGAFVLFANNYDFKKYDNIIIFIGCIFTFSVAFIIVSLIGFILLNFKGNYSSIRNVVFLLIITSIVFTALKSDDTFQKSVIERVFNIESRVDARTSSYMNSFYESFIFSNESLFGMGSSFVQKNRELNYFSGQGYKFFFIEYGIIGFLLVLLTYYFLINGHFKYGVFCLVVFLMSFIQRPFLFTPWQMILFSISVFNLFYLEKDDSKNIKNIPS